MAISLFSYILHRVRKLQETLTAVQQLEQNMVQLKQWLTHMEHEQSTPLVYETCESPEIQEKLQHQQVKKKLLCDNGP